MKIICPYCDKPATLVTGAAIYPHRGDLHALKFWQCEPCGAYVGCHRAGSWRFENGVRIDHTGVEPLGRMANAELRREKQAAHAAFDPLWKSRRMSRQQAYAWLAGAINLSEANCHIGMFDVDKCRAVVAAVAAFRSRLIRKGASHGARA